AAEERIRPPAPLAQSLLLEVPDQIAEGPVFSFVHLVEQVGGTGPGPPLRPQSLQSPLPPIRTRCCRAPSYTRGVPILVRDAQPEDFEAVTALLEDLGRPRVLGTPHQEERRALYLSWLGRDDLEAFVAESGGEVVGFV